MNRHLSPKAVMTLAVPTILSSLVMVIYNLADTYFVGMLNNSIQNSAVTLSAPVLLAFNAVNNLFGIGASSMMSRGLGKKNYDTVYRSSAFGFYSALTCGILFSVLFTFFHTPMLNILGADSTTAEATAQYLKWTVSFGAAPSILNVVMAYLVRAEGSAFHASIGTMSGCFLNIILDPIFILPWGLNMGAEGAGLATFLSNCAACLYFFVLLFVKRGHTYVCIHPKMFCLRKSIVFGIFSVGIPAAIQNLLNVTGMTVLNNFTSGYGADAVAAMGITQKINTRPCQCCLRSGAGHHAADQLQLRQRQYKTDEADPDLFGQNCSSCHARCDSHLLYMRCAPYCHFYEKYCDCRLWHQISAGHVSGHPIFMYGFSCCRRLSGLRSGRNALAFAILRKIILEIPALYILNYLFPLYGLAYAQLTAEIILAAAAVIVLIRLFKKLEHRTQ